MLFLLSKKSLMYMYMFMYMSHFVRRAYARAREQGVEIILPTYTAVGYTANLTIDKKIPLGRMKSRDVIKNPSLGQI